MTDRIPGSSWDNPVWHRGWRIYVSDCGPFSYAYAHDDYDGADDAGDSRCGHGHTIAHCKEQIDEWERDHA